MNAVLNPDEILSREVVTVGPITGTIRDGRVDLDAPAPLPNGTRVRIRPADEDIETDGAHEWPTTPEGIEAMIRELEAIEPAVLTPDERAELAKFRAACTAKSLDTVRKQMGQNP